MSAADYIARQAASVGRKAVQGTAWVPHALPGAEGACLARLRLAPPVHNRGTALALDPRGRVLYLGTPDSRVQAYDLERGQTLWQLVLGHEEDGHSDLARSPDGRWLVSLLWHQRLVTVIDLERRQQHQQFSLDTPAQAAWSPDGTLLALAAVYPNRVQVRETRTWQVVVELEATAPACVAWSADGLQLAAASSDGLWTWQRGDWQRSEHPAPPARALAFAADGSLVVGSLRGPVDLRAQPALAGRILADDPLLPLAHLALSPSGAWGACAHAGATILVWSLTETRPPRRFVLADAEPLGQACARLAWSPDEAFLAASYRDGSLALWDTRELAQTSATQAHGSVPTELRDLPGSLGALAELALWPPASTLQSLLTLLAGRRPDDPSAALAAHPGIRALVALHWPASARLGLAALLLAQLPPTDWAPPPTLTPAQLAARLTEALAGEPCPPQPAPIALAALVRAAACLDERLLVLLRLLGPQAVAREPGLPLRLLPQLPALPLRLTSDRALLGHALAHESGRASQRGAGWERTDLARRGQPTQLLPSQFALPAELFRFRARGGTLLYRQRAAHEPPRLRPTVLLLDVSPPTFGPVEELTRLAAFSVAEALLEAHQPVALVLAGGPTRTLQITSTSHLLACWTERAYAAADEAEALQQAKRLAALMTTDTLAPRILVLSHAHFGRDLIGTQADPNRHGLFIAYPGQSGRPGLPCQRHHTLPAHSDPHQLALRLRELL